MSRFARCNHIATAGISESFAPVPTLGISLSGGCPRCLLQPLISTSKTAALSRVLDGVSRGYTRYIGGVTTPEKAVAVANKFHRLYGIGCTPAQRITRKGKGQANALLVLYWPEGAAQVLWLLLATPGTGLIAEREKLLEVTGKPRLHGWSMN